jgi:hypothetical protein
MRALPTVGDRKQWSRRGLMGRGGGLTRRFKTMQVWQTEAPCLREDRSSGSPRRKGLSQQRDADPKLQVAHRGRLSLQKRDGG